MAMTDEDRSNFYRSIDGMTGRHLITKANEVLEQFEKHAETYYDNLRTHLHCTLLATLTRAIDRSYVRWFFEEVCYVSGRLRSAFQ